MKGGKNMKTRWIIGVLLAVFWLAPGTVPAVYGHGGDASLIHACVQVHNQSVRIVGANDACKANQVAIHWSITGPQGP